MWRFGALLMLGVATACADTFAPLSDEAPAPDLGELGIGFAPSLAYAVVSAEPFDFGAAIPERSFVSARIESPGGDVELLQLTRAHGRDPRLDRAMRIEIDRSANVGVVERQLRSLGIVRTGTRFFVVGDPFRAWALAPRVQGVRSVERIPTLSVAAVTFWHAVGMRGGVFLSQRRGQPYDGTLDVVPGEQVTVVYVSADGREYRRSAQVPHPQ